MYNKMQKWFTICILLLANHAFAQLTYEQLYVDYDSAVAYKNLRIIPIRYKGNRDNASPLLKNTMSFSQAMQQGLITVQERGTAAVENVHWLSL